MGGLDLRAPSPFLPLGSHTSSILPASVATAPYERRDPVGRSFRGRMVQGRHGNRATRNCVLPNQEDQKWLHECPLASIHIPSQVSLPTFPSPKTPAPFLALVLALTLLLTPGPSLGPSYRIFRVRLNGSKVHFTCARQAAWPSHIPSLAAILFPWSLSEYLPRAGLYYRICMHSSQLHPTHSRSTSSIHREARTPCHHPAGRIRKCRAG